MESKIDNRTVMIDGEKIPLSELTEDPEIADEIYALHRWGMGDTLIVDESGNVSPEPLDARAREILAAQAAPPIK